ncbi:ExbD/TolR family protein [Puniceibacterium confluentis]|uniref:ExbD/TolR family protein n=1 Tax=Puniceibacterium confluentis TaxID=1958944 RepID=UPI0011B3635A|nr:biopolymer transporter ExbD [Puniceibacterium confluentis]
MSLIRQAGPVRRITLVPLIDVLFILLVYFMVTSVYRDLDMIPMVRGSDPGAGGVDGGGGAVTSLLLRIDATGQVVSRGQVLSRDALAAALAQPGQRVLILPTGAAPLWALTEVMDAVAAAGVQDARLVRLEAAG